MATMNETKHIGTEANAGGEPHGRNVPERHAITRRSLLAGMAGMSALALGGGLAGCAPSGNAADALNGSKNEVTPEKGTGVAGGTNPQDEGFTQASTDFAALFQPLAFGSHEAPNRIMKSAAGSYAVDASINEQAIAYYREIAQGGVGVVMVEDCSFLIEGPETLKPIVDAIHEAGAIAGVQVWGLWFQASSDKNGWSPLEQISIEDGLPHAKMTTEEVHAFQQEMLELAMLHHETGFDIVEINAGCDHAFDSFLSRHWNVDRDDEYGAQSLENRARIVTELIQMIKEQCPDLAVQVLFNGVEENLEELGDGDLCMKPEEAAEFARLFEKAGADSLQVRIGSFGNHAASFLPDIMHVGSHGNTGLGTQANYASHFSGLVNGSHDGVAAFLDVAASVKAAVSIPVGTVGSMDARLAPDLVNGAVADGKVDFVAMNRPLIADAHLPNKIKEGRLDEIRPCNRCVCCFQSVVNPGGIGYCRINAAHVRAYTDEMPEGYEPAMAEKPKQVMVVGAGPAGMEAAIVAAQRGHVVTLCEKKESLGGAVPFAAAVKGPHERLADYLTYQKKRLDMLGVTVRTGTEVDKDMVASASPDAVVVAVGGSEPTAKAGTANGTTILAIDEAAARELTGRVCIIGGSLRATDYAHRLIEQGCRVDVVHEGTEADLASAQAPWPRAVMLSWLKSQGVAFHHEASDITAEDGHVNFTASFGLPCSLSCDTVVLCEDLQPNKALADEIGTLCEVVCVGDCVQPFNIQNAVLQGNLAARAL